MTGAMTGSAKRGIGIDPISAEMIRHRIVAIPDLIDRNITKTAFSPVIAEYKDYSVGIVDPEGRLICQCTGGIPIFVTNALGVAVRDGLEVYGREGIEAGDVLITNHAGTMGQHLNNIVMYTPIFVGPDNGELAGFMAVVMHWMDVGGIIVGSCVSNETTEIYQEGIQFRSIKLEKRGQPVEEIYRIIEYNTRFPRLVMGDLEAQLAGCLRGRDMFVEIVDRYGLETVREAIEIFLDQAEQASREAIRAMPDGEYRASSFLDNDGITEDVTIPIEVVVRIQGDEITIDFSGVAEQLPGPLNSGRNGGAVVAARIACKYLLTPDEPANDGAFRALKVIIPDGKFMSASADAPMGGSGYPMPTVIDTILRAVAGAAPERVAAAHHGTYGIHMFYGTHPESGELFKHSDGAIGGWGAGCDRDGSGPFRSNIHGDTQDVPVEMQEAMFPFRLDSVALRTDSAGVGEFRGGLGVEKQYTPLVPMSLNATFERSKCLPWGLNGGGEAKAGYVEIRGNGALPRRFTKGHYLLGVGDRVTVCTGGGGGFGPPTRRDPERVSADVRLGYMSRESAEADYGVVLDGDFKVVPSATEAARRKMTS
ncbi:MAG: 5-oxoprolinase [Rhodospirillaceae bacterium]|nr:5-oxoprolinase [Rhodospirillaceae bacterium]MDP6646473.1 hydantoinase B/oxoprolinase family protein [Rhodospirillales bacterium]